MLPSGQIKKKDIDPMAKKLMAHESSGKYNIPL